MIAQTQLKKPSNWQDLEKLCKLLWGEIWVCEDTIKRHGRQGQNQYEVDVFSYVEKYSGYCGIQCKGKDDYTNAQLTEAEIDNEITKALDFEPKLKLLVFATTANKDAKIEVYQTYKNQLEYRPKNSVFVQKDYRDFHMSLIPADGIKEFSLNWKFLCEDYQKEGVLTINVEPQIEEHIKTIEVHDESELKPDEISLIPKVVEE